MTEGAKKTIIRLSILAAIVIGWDIFLANNAPDGDTISESVLYVAHRHPALPFILGVIMGHLFWPQKSKY
jgi:hypothetical protein